MKKSISIICFFLICINLSISAQISDQKNNSTQNKKNKEFYIKNLNILKGNLEFIIRESNQYYNDFHDKYIFMEEVVDFNLNVPQLIPKEKELIFRINKSLQSLEKSTIDIDDDEISINYKLIKDNYDEIDTVFEKYHSNFIIALEKIENDMQNRLKATQSILNDFK